MTLILQLLYLQKVLGMRSLREGWEQGAVHRGQPDGAADVPKAGKISSAGTPKIINLKS